MPSWNEIINKVQNFGNNSQEMFNYLDSTMSNSLKAISSLRKNRNVIFYASAFLQKPQLDPMAIQITNEEINCFMAVMHGMDFSKGLSLILHTPGGMTNATETLVEYIHTKFDYVETIIPTFAMSAGTMIALSSDAIIMGRQSQLGPIDPQMLIGGKTVSARSIYAQFEKAKNDIHENVINAHLWAPILGSMSPGLLIEASKANDYSEEIVKNWLERKNIKNSAEIANYFNNPALHKSHGKRIDRKDAREKGLCVIDLEDNQDLQEAVLTAYHTMTIFFEKTPASKIVVSNFGKRWIKNIVPANLPMQIR
jgi:ATP-dependent protease ClpP protease subunit